MTVRIQKTREPALNLTEQTGDDYLKKSDKKSVFMMRTAAVLLMFVLCFNTGFCRLAVQAEETETVQEETVTVQEESEIVHEEYEVPETEEYAGTEPESCEPEETSEAEPGVCEPEDTVEAEPGACEPEDTAEDEPESCEPEETSETEPAVSGGQEVISEPSEPAAGATAEQPESVPEAAAETPEPEPAEIQIQDEPETPEESAVPEETEAPDDTQDGIPEDMPEAPDPAPETEPVPEEELSQEEEPSPEAEPVPEEEILSGEEPTPETESPDDLQEAEEPEESADEESIIDPECAEDPESPETPGEPEEPEEPVPDGFVEKDGKHYYYENGEPVTGWRRIDGNRYYFNDEGVMARGQASVDGKQRIFDQNGRLQTGLVWVKNKKLKLDENGTVIEGMQDEDGKKYYYPSSYSDRDNTEDGIIYYESDYYQLDGNNAVVTGLVKDDDELCFYDEEGKRQSGWVQTNKGWGYIWGSKLLTGGYYTLEKDGIEARFKFSKDGMLEDVQTIDWEDTDEFDFPDAARHIHIQEIIPGTEATLTTPGLTRGIRCAECGKILSPQTEIPPFSKVACFVDRCYGNILNRPADEGGLNGWTEKLEAQYLTASNIISGFVNSQEFEGKPQSNEEKVEIMYNTMLGRPSDPGGKAYWVSMLDAGLSINAVASGFSGSQEFIGICNQYGIDNGTYQLEARDLNAGVTGFVRRCYGIALGREADNGGLNHWCGELIGHAQTPQQVARGFTASQEMQSKQQSNEEYVRTMYELYLGREPDPDGFAYWINKLEEGADRNLIEDGFAYSSEFQGIVEGYGLE